MNPNEREPTTVADLQGSDPDFTGSETTDEYMRRVRGREPKSATPPITTEKLAKWRAAAEKATEGPWHVAGGIVIRGGSTGTQEVATPPLSLHDNSQAKADAELIVLSRTALPRLIDEVEAGRRGIERLSKKSYPHMCRDEHHEIGFADPEDKYGELCPMCGANNEIESLRSQLRKAQGEIDRLRGINPDSDRAAEICAEMARDMKAREMLWIGKRESEAARCCASAAKMLREAERRIRASTERKLDANETPTA